MGQGSAPQAVSLYCDSRGTAESAGRSVDGMTTQTTMLDHEHCISFRRLGGLYYAQEPGPQDPNALIPAKVGLCVKGGGGAPCPSCHTFHESESVGDFVKCCGNKLRLEPIRYVLPWGPVCKSYVPRRLTVR